MPSKIISIEIFQPFAQYRNPFTFYYAQTFPLPPKSTIIGMLQNACDDWYGNEFGIDNWWNLKVSVHGGFESVFWNYQNLIKGDIELKGSRLFNQNLPLYGYGLTSQRSPVSQQELFNGHLYIFVKAENNGQEKLLEKIKNTLEKPKKILSLGRSEDIFFIKNIKFISNAETEKIEEDIKLTFPTYLIKEDFPIKNQKFPVFSIPTKVIFENNGIPIKSKAEIIKNTERKSIFKTVIYTGFEYSIVFNKPLEAEFYKIELGASNKEFIIIRNFGWL